VDIVEWMFCVDTKLKATAAFMAGLGTSQIDLMTAAGIEVVIAIAVMHGRHSEAVAIGGIVWAKRQQCRNRTVQAFIEEIALPIRAVNAKQRVTGCVSCGKNQR
jgi:hypothetical protein